MRGYRIGAALVAGLALAAAGPLSAQQPSAGRARAQASAPAMQDPNLNPEDQLAPSQLNQPMPSAVAQPSAGSGTKGAHPPQHAAAGAMIEPPPGAPAAPGKPARPAPGRTVVACSGPFAKDSGMLALAMAYDSRNVVYTEETVQGTKVGASILFPKDPKRRLEVWWSNPNRTGTYLIDISGQSTWTGPGGLRLGLTLQELEKLNHKPFKVKGFDKDKDNVATVSDWDGGALATMPGGCKSGVSLRADPKAAADAISAVPADKEISSDDPAIRAVKPKVSEILIGY
jgi:hypothetical protein